MEIYVDLYSKSARMNFSPFYFNGFTDFWRFSAFVLDLRVLAAGGSTLGGVHGYCQGTFVLLA